MHDLQRASERLNTMGDYIYAIGKMACLAGRSVLSGEGLSEVPPIKQLIAEHSLARLATTFRPLYMRHALWAAEQATGQGTAMSDTTGNGDTSPTIRTGGADTPQKEPPTPRVIDEAIEVVRDCAF